MNLVPLTLAAANDFVAAHHRHHRPVEHLDRYLDEFTYRFNSRKETDAQRFRNSVPRVSGKRLTYAELTAKA